MPTTSTYVPVTHYACIVHTYIGKYTLMHTHTHTHTNTHTHTHTHTHTQYLKTYNAGTEPYSTTTALDHTLQRHTEMQGILLHHKPMFLCKNTMYSKHT